jgi:hypothetical protein
MEMPRLHGNEKKICMSGMTEYIAMLDVGHVLLNIMT